MGKETANKCLFIVAFFSLLTLVCTILTINVSLPILIHDNLYLAGAILFSIMQLLLIASPFLNDNRVLFLILPVAYMSSYFASISAFFGYLFLTGYDLVKVGIVPGWLSMGGFVFLDTIGLAVLVLRCFGYIKEHQAGLDTKF
jgi:hypothetical protein